MTKRIIIIEDSRDVGRMLRAALSSLEDDLSIQAFISAEEALLEASLKPVHLLVSDIRLPGKSGIELVKEMRQRCPDVCVIFITGITDQAVIRQAKLIEADGFFHKPLNMTAFLEAVRLCLAKPSQTKTVPGFLPSPSSPVKKHPSETSPLKTSVSGTSAQKSRRNPAPTRVSEVVITLRQKLGAQAVFILDENGHVVELAGELPPGDFEQEWAPRVMGAVSAAQKAARLVGEAPAPLVIALQGRDYHLALAPVAHYALIVLLKPGRASLRLGLAVEEALLAQTSVVELLELLGISAAPQPVDDFFTPIAEVPMVKPPSMPTAEPFQAAIAANPEPELAEMEEPALDEFTEKINSSAQNLNLEQANSFWDDLAAGSSAQSDNPDAITYDQARQLGLAPDEK